MSEKQTRCPKCSTVYKVTPAQLSVAQGMVCCTKCVINFNVLTNLLEAESNAELPATPNRSIFSSIQPDSSFAEKQMQILNIFDQKIENSNIDLLTYLNNLNYFNTEPVTAMPNLNLSADSFVVEQPKTQGKQHGWLYYALWGLANMSLILIFAFQILWFNPKLMQDSPILNRIFSMVCNVAKCETQAEQYKHITIEKVKVRRVAKDETRFTGLLVNNHKSSILLPSIRLELKEQGEVSTFIVLKPQDYLTDNLKSIQRIPVDRPFKFEFTIPKSRNSFDDYSLEFIQP